MAMLNVVTIPDWVPFALAAIALVAVWYVVSGLMARKRTEALAQMALEIGFNFEGTDWNDKQRAPNVGAALFNKGRDREFRNIMTGSSVGLWTSIFDCSFTVGHGRNSRTIRQTVAAFFADRILLPEFEMQPEGVLQKIGDVFVHKDIDFVSHPEFSSRYQLRGPEEERIRQLFSPGLLSFLAGLDQKQKWRVEGAARTLIVYRLGKRVKPEALRGFLEETSSIASTFFSFSGVKKTAI